MPIFDPGDISTPEGRGLAVFRLVAVMAFPEDERQQQEYLVARSADALARTGAEGLRALFEEAGGLGGVAHARALSALLKVAEDAIDGWLVSSLMLSLLVRLEQSEKVVSDQASVNKAAYLLEQQRPVFTNPDALGALPKNRSDIVSIWARFRPVAHLCTAFITWSNRAGDRFADLVYDDLGIVLASARWFQDWGLGFTPTRASRSILDRKTCWLLPESFPTGTARMAPLTNQEIVLLKAYRAPVPSH